MAPEIELMKKMYAAGQSCKAIGMQFGRSHQYAYRWLRKAGVKMRDVHGTGPEHSQWIGGRHPANDGYWRQWISPDDPLASMRNHQGYVLEHRLAMARSLGRPLLRTETVHHINDIKTDNRIENLQLRHGKHGKGIVVQCLDCGSHNIGAVPIGEA